MSLFLRSANPKPQNSKLKIRRSVGSLPSLALVAEGHESCTSTVMSSESEMNNQGRRLQCTSVLRAATCNRMAYLPHFEHLRSLIIRRLSPSLSSLHRKLRKASFTSPCHTSHQSERAPFFHLHSHAFSSINFCTLERLCYRKMKLVGGIPNK